MTPRREDARLIFCEDRLCSGRHPRIVPARIVPARVIPARVIPEGEPRKARACPESIP
jgi:hypothetical protein